jgi:hypothetical protein
VRAHLQNPATKCGFPIGYFIFLLTLEKCAILQCSVLSIRSKLPFLFHRVLVFLSCLFCVVSVYLLKKQFLEVKKFLYVNKMSQFRSPNKRHKLDLGMLTASNSFLLMHKFIFIANFSQAKKRREERSLKYFVGSPRILPS